MSLDVPVEPPLAELIGITRHFGSFVANDSINLTLEGSKIHALLGENGAGKSTLVKILYGLLQPDAGEIRMNGKALRFDSPSAARRAGIGMVFQHFSLFDSMSVLENIALGCDGVRADRIFEQRVMQLAGEYGLELEPQRPVWSLSAGERQRIEILRCLLQNPQLIILDEPTSVLAPAETETLFATLQKLTANGTAILFISHKLEEVRAHCTSASILRQGKLVATCDPRLESARSLAGLMIGNTLAEIQPRPHQAGETLLKLEAISTRSTGTHDVDLKNLSLEAHSGEIIGIAGIAGNGQSELFNIISGETGPPDGGRIEIAGVSAAGLGINERRQLGAAFMPEERLGHAALPDASLTANLLLSWHEVGHVSKAGWLDWLRIRSKALDVIRDYNVQASSPDPKAKRLSGGNLQKFVIGREVMLKPRLIIVHQPTWGIDAASARSVRQSLLDAAAAGACVVIISQDLDELLEISDRLMVLAEGKLSEELTPEQRLPEQIGLMMTASNLSTQNGAIADAA